MRLLLAMLFWGAAWAQQTPEPKYDMTTYQLVLLQKGPNWTAQSTPETRKLQEGHMANIRRMAATGKLTVAGPVLRDGALRGIFIFTGASQEEVKAWCAGDPAVQSGRLVVEIYPWMAAKGLKVDPPK